MKKKTNLSDSFKDKKVTRGEWWIKYRIDEDDTVSNALKDMEHMINDNEPKNSKGFTGGYLQRLSNDNTLMLYYGYDSKRNSISENLKIDDHEFEYISDIFNIYMFYFQKANRPIRKKLIVRRRSDGQQDIKDNS